MKLNADTYHEFLIRGGTVWDGTGFSKRDILIKNGIIVKIEACIKEKAEHEFDAENGIVSSGLVDAHTHMKGISPDSIGIPAENISYPFGVTHLVDASAYQGNAAFLSNVDGNISVLAEARIVDNQAEFSCVEKMMSSYKDKLIGLKVYFDKTFVNVWNTQPLKEICSYAKRHGLFVMVHTTNSPVSMLDIVDALNEGDVISHAFHGGDNNASANGFESLKRAKEKGIYTDAALSTYYHIDYSIFQQAVKQGIYPDIISSDITKEQEFVSSEQKYGLPICMSILQRLGLDTANAFRAVTVTPAALLKTKANQGFLKIGDVADIAVFQLENGNVGLTDTANNKIEVQKYWECVLTITDGHVVYMKH